MRTIIGSVRPTRDLPRTTTIHPSCFPDLFDHIIHGCFASCFHTPFLQGLYLHQTILYRSLSHLILSLIAAMPDMEVQISPQTQAALKTDLTLRCLIQTKYHPEKSRRSAVVIPWAQSQAERLSSAVVQDSGQQTAGFSIQLNMIQLLDLRDIVYICYDLFLDECDAGLRAEISENFDLKRPIHMMTRKHKVFIIRRDERADARVLHQYLDMSRFDKGPRPFFSDSKHPPVFDHNGHRMIEWEELTERFPAWLTEKMNEGKHQEKPAEGDDLKPE